MEEDKVARESGWLLKVLNEAADRVAKWPAWKRKASLLNFKEPK